MGALLSLVGRTVDLVTLTAIIAPVPAEFGATPDDITEVITADAGDYDTAKAALEAQVPDGWRMLSIRAW